MKPDKSILLILLTLAWMLSCTRSEEKDTMERLKSTMEHKGVYEQNFLDRTSILRSQLYSSSDTDKKWNAAYSLYEEYLSYDIDSALVYSGMLQALADNKDKEMVAAGSQVPCLCALRMYSAAKDILNNIDTTDLGSNELQAYYKAHIALYTALGNEFSREKTSSKENKKKRYYYQDLLCKLPTLSDNEHTYMRGKQLMLEGDYDQALDSLYKVLDMDITTSSRLHTTYAIANCYKAKGDYSKYKRWLAETAILDFQRPNRQYRSLYDLALCLYEDGSYSQAAEFIQQTVIDAIACKYDTRIVNAVETQMIIKAAQDEDTKNEERILTLFICVTLSALLLISVTLIKVIRQKKRLRALMRQAKVYNHELAEKNDEISEANLLKEKYMFKYMYLSANFIKEMDEYRKNLRHTYKENGIDALMSKLREPEYMYMQYKSFYKLFDEIFLGIFPDFPDKVNNMLKEGKQINIKHKGTLPTEFRILAVIRLGITESRKIAEFLNTSVNTVYTYRTKMRYDSIDGPDNFEENVKNIDCFKFK
jgi:tetratricopeptide (TPR) repeat protein